MCAFKYGHITYHWLVIGYSIPLQYVAVRRFKYKWSRCSIKDLAATFRVPHSDACLLNKPQLLQSENAVCGNYLTEAGRPMSMLYGLLASRGRK